MARGTEGKAARKEARKEERSAEKAKSPNEGENDFDLPEPNGDNGGDPPLPSPEGSSAGAGDDEPIQKKSRRKKKKAPADEKESAPPPAASRLSGIKMGPLVMLVMLTGTTLLPALLFAGDWFGAFLQKNHILGSVGHKLGVGSSPKKRVLSFYEKHDPEKIDDVGSILGKYYGDYPKLIKRLERKYADYGYFIDWEKDEAPMTLAMDKLYDTRDYVQKQFNKYAPQQVKIATRNIKFNLMTLQKKFKKVWRKHLWPLLEPVFGVPDGGSAQKRKDRTEAMDKKGRRKKNT